MKPTPLVSLCVICHDRPDELRATLGSAAGEPWHEIIVLDMASDPPLGDVPGVRALRSNSNLGPPAGRNILAANAVGDLIVFLDDDVVLLTPVVDAVAALFESRPDLAVVAFKVQRTGGLIASTEAPFRRRWTRPEGPRECAYFVSAGYACRRMAVDAVGGYEEDLFIHTEELELSFNLISHGWKLWYEPSIAVEHHPSRRGRSAIIPAYAVRNRILIVRRYLPLVLQPVHITAWILLTAAHAWRAGAMHTWASGLKSGWRLPVRRRRIPFRQLVSIHRMGGRVLY